MTTDPFSPPIVQHAVQLQANIKEAEQRFREAIHEMATVHPELLSDEAVGPWLEVHLVNALAWTKEEVQELREVTQYQGAHDVETAYPRG